MSDALQKLVKSPQEVKVVIGCFDLAAGAATVGTKYNQDGLWDVAKTGTGLYTVTFTNKYFAGKEHSIDAWGQGSSASVLPAAVVTPMQYSAANRTLIIGTSTAAAPGTLADLAVAAAFRIHFGVTFRDSRT